MLSKINGWITVDPQTMNRREAFEKRKSTNVQKESLMAPNWMQIESTKDTQRFKLFKPVSTNGINMRIE